MEIYWRTKFRWDISIYGWDKTTSGFGERTAAILEFYFRFRSWPMFSPPHVILLQPAKFCGNPTTGVGVTGSAVALHCCKAHSKINRKMGNSTPCKIVTPENFNLKLCISDYVGEATRHANFGSNRYSEGFSPYRRNITTLWLFVLTVLSCPVLSFFFSETRPGRTAEPIFTLYGSNDVFSCKEVPFGGQDDGWRHLGNIPPKLPKNGRE